MIGLFQYDLTMAGLRSNFIDLTLDSNESDGVESSAALGTPDLTSARSIGSTSSKRKSQNFSDLGSRLERPTARSSIKVLRLENGDLSRPTMLSAVRRKLPFGITKDSMHGGDNGQNLILLTTENRSPLLTEARSTHDASSMVRRESQSGPNKDYRLSANLKDLLLKPSPKSTSEHVARGFLPATKADGIPKEMSRYTEAMKGENLPDSPAIPSQASGEKENDHKSNESRPTKKRKFSYFEHPNSGMVTKKGEPSTSADQSLGRSLKWTAPKSTKTSMASPASTPKLNNSSSSSLNSETLDKFSTNVTVASKDHKEDVAKISRMHTTESGANTSGRSNGLVMPTAHRVRIAAIAKRQLEDASLSPPPTYIPGSKPPELDLDTNGKGNQDMTHMKNRFINHVSSQTKRIANLQHAPSDGVSQDKSVKRQSSKIKVESTIHDRAGEANVWEGPSANKRISFSESSTGDSTSEAAQRRLRRSKIGSKHELHGPSMLSGEAGRGYSTPPKLAQQNSYPILQSRDKTRICTYPLYTLGSMLRYRDIGGPSGYTARQSFMRIRDSCLDTMIKPWRNWTGASKDVISSAWAPDGKSLAIGASTDLDSRNQMYNRKNNLLWCDLVQGTILELDEHKIERSMPDQDSSQGNTVSRNILDPHVFTTISDICYGSGSDRFYTASYDNTIKMWDVSSTYERPRCVGTMQHQEPVNILTNCDATSTEVLACAERSKHNAVQVFEWKSKHTPYILDTAQTEKYSLTPTALAWGSSGTSTGSLLAVGYGDDSSQNIRRSRGDILVWDAVSQTKLIDLIPRLQYVYDLAWHLQLPWLAAATSPRSMTRSGMKGVQSNIRIWNPIQAAGCMFDLDCPALDINRVLLHPFDLNYISAACTDGSIYHYDLRKPQNILAKFEHEESIAQLDDNIAREAQDYGIQFVSWNAAGTLLYSGSSDGKVKQWNPYLNEKDAFITDIASFDAGISCGRFSPDLTNLLIGTTKGSIHVLSSAPVTPWSHGDDKWPRRSFGLQASQDETRQGLEKSEQVEDASFKYWPTENLPLMTVGTAAGTETQGGTTITRQTDDE